MIPVTEETKKTHKSALQVSWQLKVFTPDGRLVEEKHGENSLIAGFGAKMAAMLCYNDSTIQEHDITNSLQSTYYLFITNSAYAGWPINGYYNNSPYNVGLMLGTNNTAVTSDDYKLNTIIAPGSGGSQLIHMEGANNAVVTSAPVSSFSSDRVFINHSGGTITVKEMGMYTYDSNGKTWCLCRDIIADPGTDIIDGNYLFLRYTISITT